MSKHLFSGFFDGNNSTSLRAAVLGANDGILSVSCLLVGMISAHASHDVILLSGITAMIAGALSMAAGEIVSVYAQKDSDMAAIERERINILSNEDEEEKELASIYIERGLEKSLAEEVAEQFMDNDALEAHARDELGINSKSEARPFVAGISSALSFIAGSFVPLFAAAFVSESFVSVAIFSVIMLAILGYFSSRLGESEIVTSIIRIVITGIIILMISLVLGNISGDLL